MFVTLKTKTEHNQSECLDKTSTDVLQTRKALSSTDPSAVVSKESFVVSVVCEGSVTRLCLCVFYWIHNICFLPAAVGTFDMTASRHEFAVTFF